MMQELEGKVALVTGGGRGIGAGIAEGLAQAGATVALMGRSRAPLEEVDARIQAGGGRASVHIGSVSNPDEVERVLDDVLAAHGSLEIIVNNAGIVDEADFLDISLEGWNKTIGTDLTGAFLVTQRAARRMRGTGGGSVVNIASIDANGYDGPQGSYVAAKAGLVGLTKNAAVELAQHSIRVNSVSPGWTRTPMVEEFVSEKALQHMMTDFQRVPMKRLVEIPELANAVVFLVSDKASAITGIDLPVDCGTLATLYVYETIRPLF
ncbi:glucose 1-dehydrogenase [Rhizobium sp. CNPSo 3490]|uniref:SDR family NAD(P)-dependent oxidoreductase n=1 Tax=Rhizobium sp. CNPSo 3490 TaxID=3021407 RepID=UPI00254BEFA7|nr:glucose 1-dehydrogenase [Rhizobium sp. CNPSo 3490]MDK4732002.1 glucose 1-dehydrogenase [Rhizobium sp. CNPSo 3490]